MPRSGKPGFTLVELLVVIGIIAVLMGILLPVLKSARQVAMRCKTASDMRQMMTGYQLYAQDNQGALLWGYTPTTVNGKLVQVSDPVRGGTYGVMIADRYPWRMLPYCQKVWQLIHGHTDLPPLPSTGDTDAVAWQKAYDLSLNPSFGINSTFVGGDKNYQGFLGDRPNTGRHVVFRLSEVRDTSRLIVFAESQAKSRTGVIPGKGELPGMHYLTPPRSKGENWIVQSNNFVLQNDKLMGIPQGRYGDKAVVGFMDGHVEMLRPDELTDMRLWSARATSDDWDY